MSISQPGSETFEKRVLESEKQKLTYYTAKTNSEQSEELTENMFINLSLREIFANFAKTIIDIMNDLTVSGTKDILNTFSKDDRLIYIGLLIVFIAFSIYLIDITS